ncbi:MAG: DUF669 domain-containing protein [Beijerinckiaceae bacterium]|nr:DUF669 domain-containing protein [Beijerinckiaceae bacterium]
MANMGGFNPDEVPDDDRGGLDPIPPGRYELEVVDSDLVQTKSGTGMLLKLQHRVVSGQYENRRIFSQHNFKNDNPVAQEIGQREIKALCAAIGHMGPLEDSNDLHGITFTATVKLGKTTPDYPDPKNEISRFIPRSGGEAPAQRQAAQRQPSTTPAQRQTAPAANAGGNRPGWMNKPAGASVR